MHLRKYTGNTLLAPGRQMYATEKSLVEGVTLPASQAAYVTAEARKLRCSRAEVIRRAIALAMGRVVDETAVPQMTNTSLRLEIDVLARLRAKCGENKMVLRGGMRAAVAAYLAAGSTRLAQPAPRVARETIYLLLPASDDEALTRVAAPGAKSWALRAALMTWVGL